MQRDLEINYMTTRKNHTCYGMGLQPFARAIQRAVDLPVFSWGTLLDYANSYTTHRDYYESI